MANKVSSAPLFGSSSPKEIAAIQKHMEAFTANVAKDPVKARRLLEETGAVLADAPREPAQP
jgi:hypothetical protein